MSIKIGDMPFKEHVEQELQNRFMRTAISTAQDRLRINKIGATINDEQFGDWEEWRNAAEEIRRHTIDNLDYYLNELSENYAARGGKVFFASTIEEANNYIKEVIEEKNAKHIVKTKSMVTEEMGLNEVLENSGCEVVETDLGEYIIQIDQDRPSHIVAPALHKNKEQIRDSYREKIGYEGSENPQELTSYTRKILREKFLNADVAITGCNFAVANSGAITLVTNEGNANMATTLPDTHITVMGMERIVPSWEDLDILVSLLCRSAVGQKISTYVTAVAPVMEDDSIDGPTNSHLVILDGGRSKMLGTEFQDILHCIRCAACVNVCPVYRHIGGHAYGSIYQGPIGAVLSPILEGYDQYGELPYASSLCGACTEVCPVKIPLHELLVRHREQMVSTGSGKVKTTEKLMMKGYGTLTSNPSLFNIAKKSAKTFTLPIQREGKLKYGVGAMKEWLKSREFPSPQKDEFKKWFYNRPSRDSKEKSNG